ncbi:MAG: bi-domain-containing oxidoreductase [Deltaproteobacteria bacterium]|nr:bi-domain-containing oxidoreductase [Deltaproteobacteria bacterium]
MRQLIQSYKTGEMEVADVPAPSARHGGVVVRTVRSLVSAGTEKMVVDLAQKSLLGKARARPDLVRKVIDTARKQGVMNTFKKVQTKLDTPIPLGYSSAGVVVEVGEGVPDHHVGERVACGGAGYANHADYAYVPRNLVARIPDGVSMEDASFATVGAIALQGVRQAAPTLGERVAVLGLGLIGQLTVQLLRANGCQVLGFDPNASRAALAVELGAHEAVSEGLVEAAERFSQGRGFDAVIVAASAPSAEPLAQAGEIARMCGRVVVVGLVKMEIDRSVYYRKELDLRMSMSYGPGRYDADFEERGFDYPLAHVRWTEQRNLEAFLDLIADGRLDLGRLVTHRYEIGDALDAYELISSGREPYLGVTLSYGADDEAAVVPPDRVELSAEPLTGDVRVGMIGAGSFGQTVLLPALKAAGGVDFSVIASAGGTTARRIGDQYGFRTATADSTAVLESPNVDAAFILTRHDLHAELIVKGLEAGKHIFTEKPLALTGEELDAITKAHDASPGGVMVGFNRRFAPLVGEIQKHFEGRTHPLAMYYRVNAGSLPNDHWIHDPREGGGRIRGEGCHFIDLCHHLAGSLPVRVFAECIAGDTRYRSDDNVSITIRFADGSIATLLYTAMGDNRQGKEYLEVFGEGRIARLEDYRSLELHSGGSTRKEKSANQDKGFEEEMRRFVAAARSGGEMPIPYAQLVGTTRATLAAVESLRTGEPVDL